MLRFALALPVALILALGMFWLMQWMITPDESFNKHAVNTNMIDFVRLKRENRPPEQKRRKPPEAPKPKPMPKMSTPTATQENVAKTQNLDIKMPSLRGKTTFAKGPKLALPSMSGDSDLIALVRMQPQYPMRAKRMGLEGFVSLRVYVDTLGLVERVEVLEADPKWVFEREAIRAVKRWKFKPKTLNGTAIKHSGTLRLDFKMKE